MRLGFASQMAGGDSEAGVLVVHVTRGCDGGFRSPFILYVSVWITGLVFGILLLILEDPKNLGSELLLPGGFPLHDLRGRRGLEWAASTEGAAGSLWPGDLHVLRPLCHRWA